MAATDILTLDECQQMLGATGEAELLVIQTYISAASAKLDAMCGPVMQTAAIVESHDGGTATVRVDLPPIYAVTSVVEYAAGIGTTLAAETTTAVTGDRYQLYADTGRIVRRNGGSDSVFTDGRRNIVVTYTAGRYAAVTDVAPKFKQSCFMIVDRLWRLYQASGSATYGTDEWVPARAVPPMVNELLADELLPVPVA